MIDHQDFKGPLAGVVSETLATIWLMGQGFEVFRNVKPYGPADIVTWNPATEEYAAIDVKTVRKYIKQDGSVTYHNDKRARRPGVQYLGYDPDDGKFLWLN
jgi:Holliday junction resolvase-like predicted endonuclease